MVAETGTRKRHNVQKDTGGLTRACSEFATRMTDTRSDPEGWNRNTHYHDRLLAALPRDCRRVVDVGCGLGTFARRLAHVVEHVDALDRDPGVLAQAACCSRDVPNVRFVQGDFIAWQPETRYDAVSMLAVLHHLPFRAALLKAAALLRPGGVLLGYRSRPLAFADSLCDHRRGGGSYQPLVPGYPRLIAGRGADRGATDDAARDSGGVFRPSPRR